MTKTKLIDTLTRSPEDPEIDEVWVSDDDNSWTTFYDVDNLIPHLMDRSIDGYGVSNVEFGESRSRQGGIVFITLKRSRNLLTNIDADFLQVIIDNFYQAK